MVAWTIEQALAAERVDRVVLSTDGDEIAAVGRACGVEVIERPPDLADDAATVDSAARHAVLQIERTDGRLADAVVILYGNVPVRPETLIDDAVAKLLDTGCDSVQSVTPVGKHHPYWMQRLEGDRLLPNVEHTIHRRQDLPPLYELDGGIIAVTRPSLFTVVERQPHAFLGADRRAIVTAPGTVVDVDIAADLWLARHTMGKRYRAALPEATIEPVCGDDMPVLVIAELGVNHDGSVERALELTRAAAGAGAGAVKLQLFDPDQLFSADAELAGYQSDAGEADPIAMLRRLQLTVPQMLRVKTEARRLGLRFIVTPFSLGDVEALRDLDPDAVKIASPDIVNLPLLRRAAALGKHMLVSTGAATHDEAIAGLEAAGRYTTTLLQCVSSYPVPDEKANVGLAISIWQGHGYSDHTTNMHTGMVAAAAGACVIEKHLTYDRSAAGPDHAASFDPDQFAEYVRLIRLAETLRGERDIEKDVLDIEQDVRRVSRQSVCAVRDLPAGHTIAEDDVTVKRPGTGIPAARLGVVIGKRTTRAIAANHLLHEGDVAL